MFWGRPDSAKLSPADWNKFVDGFDTGKLAAQLAEIKPGYFMLGLGQNSGHYCCPNSAYDKIMGWTDPRESKCSRRDLVSDLHAALSPLGIKIYDISPGSGAPLQGSARRF